MPFFAEMKRTGHWVAAAIVALLALGAAACGDGEGVPAKGKVTHALTLNSATYSYNAAGLVTSVSDLKGTRTVSAPGAGVSSSVGGKTYTYDQSGRLVQKGDLSLSYGPDGQVATARRGTDTWSFIYDEAGNRVAKLKNGKFVAAYIDGSYLTDDGFVDPVKVAGVIVGVLDKGTFKPLATDPRGTVLSAEDGTPNLPTAYGERTSRPATSPALDYVEKGYDADLGFVRMGVRDYDPFISQFTTPDPLFFEDLDRVAKSPVEGNLYSYAGNNPVSFVDPTGTHMADVRVQTPLRQGAPDSLALGFWNGLKDFLLGRNNATIPDNATNRSRFAQGYGAGTTAGSWLYKGSDAYQTAQAALAPAECKPCGAILDKRSAERRRVFDTSTSRRNSVDSYAKASGGEVAGGAKGEVNVSVTRSKPW